MSSPVANFGSQDSLIEQQIHVLQLELQQFLEIEELELEQAKLGIRKDSYQRYHQIIALFISYLQERIMLEMECLWPKYNNKFNKFASKSN